MASYQVKQSSTAYPLVFLMVQSSDHVTGLTGASPTVTLSKSGGAFASPSGAVTEIANGWYKVAGNATDTATLGPLALHATAASGDPVDVMYEVIAHDVQDAVHLGLSCLPNATAAASGGLLTYGSTTGQLNPSGGATPVSGDLTSTMKTSVATAVLATPANALATDSSGRVILQPTQTGVTIPAVTTTTNLTNAPTAGDLTATMKTSVTTAASSATPVATLNFTQAIPTSNTAQTVGDALNAARAQGFGKWVISGTTVTLYAGDGTTVVHTFTLDSATAPTQRS